MNLCKGGRVKRDFRLPQHGQAMRFRFAHAITDMLLYLLVNKGRAVDKNELRLLLT
jgi:hypothetical protein